MKTISAVLYEVSKEDVKRLPTGFEVLEINTLYERTEVKLAGVDAFRWQRNFRHYLLKMPPLTVVN